MKMIKESFKQTVALPEGVQVDVDGNRIGMHKGDNENSRIFKVRGASFKKIDQGIEVKVVPATRKMNARLKTIAGHLKNMATGLDNEFVYKLVIVFSHFPMTVNAKGNVVEINNFAGEKKPRIAKILPGVKVEIKGKDITVKGHNKESVGQTAANLENSTKVKGRDRRIFQDGIFIMEKAKPVESSD